ncbi:hypothetical protein SPLC1_S101480 [Arthrospira platensis C1]|uniref:Uncharacterized protein n=1 Tax=Limnospira indica PCC 8005 TaxID=376219 RepID=A0A9P1KC87_9CYAN|nr:hypothetical protein SPLC1_S101480 [Arthrospira platensis C1]CDM92694.1 conserved protein of unknown function [Limnospira indica PCC 8005]
MRIKAALTLTRKEGANVHPMAQLLYDKPPTHPIAKLIINLVWGL